ncbi:MAG: DNA translocase FtsK 4TM domain-containing protein, partial [Patescibacteria group bacterium]
MKSKYKERIKQISSLEEETKEKEPKIGLETKKSIAAILMIGLAALLLLAKLDKAGPIGQITYNGLNSFFGWGYYLLPLMSIIVALVFLIGQKQKFLSTTFIGAIFVIIFGLGLIDIVFPEHGGVVGNVLGLIEEPFGYTGGLVLTSVFILISLLVTLNAKIKIISRQKSSFADDAEDKEEIE